MSSDALVKMDHMHIIGPNEEDKKKEVWTECVEEEVEKKMNRPQEAYTAAHRHALQRNVNTSDCNATGSV